MKKIFSLLAISVLCCGGAHADYASLGGAMQIKSTPTTQTASSTPQYCGETTISFDGFQGPDDNEFLYTTQQAYESVKNNRDNGRVSGGKVYECDNEHCLHNHVQDMPAGHYFKGVKVNHAAKYRCVTGIEDKWVEITEGCEIDRVKLQVGDWYQNGSKRVALNVGRCEQFEQKVDDNGTEFNARCEKVNNEIKMVCHLVKCKKGMKVSGERCVTESNQVTKKTCSWQGNTIEVGSSYSQKLTYEQCKTITSTVDKNGTAFTLRCEDKNPNPQLKCYLSQCKSGMKKSGEKCVKDGDSQPQPQPQPEPQPDVPEFDCPASDIALLYQWRSKYSSESEIVSLIDQILAYCEDSSRTATEYNRRMSELRALINEQIQITLIQEQQTTSTSEITKIVKEIKSTNEQLQGDVTVWRDAEGDFNTARLASDSIAAVVLGTAGGLITSHVIKKNQVKNGFEDINCSIGGQTVAGWGDEFNVGIQ